VEDGVTTRAAFGVLMAYEDLNGNGLLDTIPAGGSPIDRVLGTSLGDRFNGDDLAQQVYVAFVDGVPPASWVGYGSGYQLWQNGSIVAASTPVPIPLAQTNELNFFVCEEFIASSGYGYDLPCNIAPTGGVRVIGNVYRHEGQGGVGMRITDGTNALPNLGVEVNGVAVPYDAASQLYAAYGNVPVNTPGRNTVRVTVPGQQARVFEMDAPGDFALQPPVDGKRMLAGTALDVQWIRAAGASFYQAGAYRFTPPHDLTGVELVYDRGQASLGASISGFSADDYYQLEVVAFAPGYLARGLGGSMVNVSTQRRTYVDVLPANAGLRVEGSVTHVTWDGQTFGSAWVSVFDGLTELNAASVSLGGTALTFEPQYQLYGTDSATLTPGAAAVLDVAGNGKPAVQAQVVLPGDFVVNGVPASHASSAVLPLSWSASAGATYYRVWVTDGQGNLLFTQNVLGATALDVPALNTTGDVYLGVAAMNEGTATATSWAVCRSPSR
jgi:hypothetical protein